MSDIPAEFGVDGDQYRMSGTSMAAPHVAGAAALLAQARPEQSGAQLRATLVGSAQELGVRRRRRVTVGPGCRQAGRGRRRRPAGHGLPRCRLAGAGRHGHGSGEHPHRRAAQLRRPRSVTVKLAAEAAEGSTGKAELSARQVRIPAGRSASVDLTVTPEPPPGGGHCRRRDLRRASSARSRTAAPSACRTRPTCARCRSRPRRRWPRGAPRSSSTRRWRPRRRRPCARPLRPATCTPPR